MHASSHPILVFGEALIDDFGERQVVGGAPFNVARHLAAFGLAPLMVTRIGSDAPGALIRAEFTRFGLTGTGLQVDAAQPTGRVLVERGELEHRFVILPDQAYDRIETPAALRALAGASPATLYFGTLAQRGDCSRATLHALLAATAATRFLDLNMRDGQVDADRARAALHAADIVKVNGAELAALAAWFGLPGDLDASCTALLRRFSLASVIVTLGEAGAVWCSADGTVERHGPGPLPAPFIDTVGAGDAFAAVCLLGRTHGWPLAATLARANAFAAALCTVPGAVPADLAFYAPWCAAWFGAAARSGAQA